MTGRFMQLKICLIVILAIAYPCGAQTIDEKLPNCLQQLAKKAAQQGMGKNLAVRIHAIRDRVSRSPKIRITSLITKHASPAFRTIESDAKAIAEINKILEDAMGPDYDPDLITEKRGMGIPAQAILEGTYHTSLGSWELSLTLTTLGKRQQVSVHCTGTRLPSILVDIPQTMKREDGATQEMTRTMESALTSLLIKQGFTVQSLRALSFFNNLKSRLKREGATTRVVADLAGCDLVLTGNVPVRFSNAGQEQSVYGITRGRRVTYHAHPDLVVLDMGSGQATSVLSSIQDTEGYRGDALAERDAEEEAKLTAARRAVEESLNPVWQQMLSDLQRAIPGLEKTNNE